MDRLHRYQVPLQELPVTQRELRCSLLQQLDTYSVAAVRQRSVVGAPCFVAGVQQCYRAPTPWRYPSTAGGRLRDEGS